MRLATAGLLLLALARLPYGYYQFLRLIVCAVSAYTAYLAFTLPNRQVWMWGFGAVALLFNPVAPVYLSKGTWAYIDVATAVMLLTSVFFVAPRPPR